MSAFFARIIGNRLLALVVLAIPALYLLNEKIMGRLGAWKTNDIQIFLGNTAIVLLIVVLCFTPLRVLFPNWPIASALNRHRRAVGVSSALYALWHFLIFVRAEPGYEAVMNDLSRFVYLQAGLVALIILLILMLTSNRIATFILPYPIWKTIHRLAYFAAAFAFFHRAFGVEKETLQTTVMMFAPLVVLEGLRVGKQVTTGIYKRVWKFLHRPAFKGSRKFRVARKVHENDDITSIYLEPVDGKKLKPFKPGQYLTYEFDIPGREGPVARSYSLSDAPSPGHYRASIKRVTHPRDHPEYPNGLVSNYVHDELEEGTILNVRAPAGEFCLDLKSLHPVVLLGAGVGLTPVLSMLKALANHQAHREVWFFYGTRDYQEDAMRSEIDDAISRLKNGHLVICHSNPKPEEKEGEHYHVAERISVDLLQRMLPHRRYHFYFCGPPPMMQSLYDGLTKWGVPEKRMHYEAFGPSSIGKKKKLPKGAVSPATVRFLKSKKTLHWTGQQQSLLEFAEANNIKLKFGCRAGACGTCKLKLRKGNVVYTKPPSADAGSKGCLVCVGIPGSDPVELDA